MACITEEIEFLILLLLLLLLTSTYDRLLGHLLHAVNFYNSPLTYNWCFLLRKLEELHVEWS